jgi:dCTP deaminase
MILNDKQITELAKQGMIEPFLEERLQPFGYDITLSTKFKIFRGREPKGLLMDSWPFGIGKLPLKKLIKMDWVLDPFNTRESDFEEIEDEVCIIPPLSFALGVSVERFEIPNDVVGQCLGRSSYSRMGINPNVTPLEAGWSGFVTMEIINATSMPNMVYANKGISQVQFHRGEMPQRTYVSKGGRYNNQEGVTLTKGV